MEPPFMPFVGRDASARRIAGEKYNFFGEGFFFVFEGKNPNLAMFHVKQFRTTIR